MIIKPFNTIVTSLIAGAMLTIAVQPATANCNEHFCTGTGSYHGPKCCINAFSNNCRKYNWRACAGTTNKEYTLAGVYYGDCEPSSDPLVDDKCIAPSGVDVPILD